MRAKQHVGGSVMTSPYFRLDISSSGSGKHLPYAGLYKDVEPTPPKIMRGREIQKMVEEQTRREKERLREAIEGPKPTTGK